MWLIENHDVPKKNCELASLVKCTAAILRRGSDPRLKDGSMSKILS